MKFFDAGSEAKGFIAFGQQATGFVAVGQMATGVIAIGQLARGVIAIGQLGIGLVGWGQGGVGVFHAAGMLGVGGRRGIGGILQLVPTIGRPRIPPTPTSVQFVNAGTPGWLELDLGADASGLGLFENGVRTPIKLDRRVLAGAARITAQGPVHVWAFTKRVGQILVCQRIAHVPVRAFQEKSFLPIAIVQVILLLALGAAYWPAVGNDLITFTNEAFSSPAPTTTFATPPPRPPTPYKPRSK